ncbi:hypothetical protein P3T76_010342 [Phytophthora citrophthora]|uniref:Uncharacterized protein n=1 Tax=Phytophthora citrophthora TaxID=4793 RepID=A0AAD9LHB6_9STRA|nr:hypothetical protein P3T76_010342 [Phytophthora citrophthora]
MALKDLRNKNKKSFEHIEDVLRLDPDGMALKMREMDMIDLTLLEKYTKYYVKKHPTWVSNLE